MSRGTQFERHGRRALTALVIGALALLAPVAVEAQEEDVEATGPASPAPSPGLVTLGQAKPGSLLLSTQQPGVYVSAPPLETDMVVHVTGPIVRTRVTQRFSNISSDLVEGVYLFPLPEKAAVDRLRMRVADRLIEGRIEEKAEAQRTYQQAQREGKKASLVSQKRPNVFTTSVANIGPQEVVEIVIEFQHTADYDAGLYRLRLPLVVAPRFDPVAAGTQIASVGSPPPPYAPASFTHPPLLAPGQKHASPLTLAVALDAGVPLASLESSYHPIVAVEDSPGRYLITLAPDWIPADRDFELVWRPQSGQLPRTGLFTERLNGDLYTLLTLLPPEPGAGAPRLPRETIFVIDTSGSMKGTSIRQAKAALDFALEHLAPEDSFNLIQFNSNPERLFPASLPTGSQSLAEARSWIAGLEAGGGTEMALALAAALSAQPTPGTVRQVVFITDGSVSNEAQLFQYLETNLGRNRLFTVGIGAAPNGHFMRRAAQFGRGTFTYIGAAGEVEEKMTLLFEKLEHPVLTDLEIVWEDPGAEIFPERLPDLYAGEPLVVAARLGRAGGEVVLSGRLAGAPWNDTLRLPPAQDQRGIEKLWARQKIATLMDGLQRGSELAIVRQAVVELALEHHLVSRFTSLVAVDVTPTVAAGSPNVKRPVPLQLPAGRDSSVPFPQTATSAPLLRWLGLLLIGLSLVLFRFGRRSARCRSSSCG